MLNVETWVHAGGVLALIDPVFGMDAAGGRVTIFPSFKIQLEPPSLFNALQGGGYDSILWLGDVEGRESLFAGVTNEDLWFFNGGYGAEISPDFKLVPMPTASKVMAVTGPGLSRNVIFEVAIGAGKVVVLEVELRGRLTAEEDPAPIYNRRVDPIAQRLLLNLIDQYAR